MHLVEETAHRVGVALFGVSANDQVVDQSCRFETGARHVGDELVCLIEAVGERFSLST